MANKRDTVRPDELQDGEFGDHTLTVELLYERQQGQWYLIGVDYLCFNCMSQAGVEHPRLYAMPESQLHDSRLYLLGKLLDVDCK